MTSAWKRIFSLCLVLCLLTGAVAVPALALTPDDFTGDRAAAAARLREGLAAYESEITVLYKSVQPMEEADAKEIFSDALAKQTLLGGGTPYTGDYLLLSVSNVEVQAEYTVQDIHYYYRIVYHVTYANSLEREMELREAVKQLTDTMRTETRNDYQRCKGIYDYLRANGLDGEPDAAAALFYAMAISNGMDSRVVTAVADGKPHSFNLVKVYDKWYAVDVTRGAFLQGKDAIAGYTLDAFYTTNAFQKQYPLSDTAFDPANTASGALENGLRWRYDAAKAALIISGQGAMQDFALQSFSGIQTVTRPWTAYVSEGANYILEEGVTALGSYALYGVVFDSIKLPSTLQTVGEGAFRESRGIAIALPEGLKEIGKEAFMDSHVMQLSVPDSVTAIGDRAFSGCARLDALGIPAGIESVGEALVDGCLSLRKVLFLGDEETWAAVAVGGNNQKLKDLLRNGSGGFFDVPEQEWFYAPVQWAAERNVTGGVGNGRFGAYDGCTRAQVVTFLWAANGKPAPKNTNNPFEDVADDAWYLKPVLWAVETGITTGISDTQFGPDGTCTRAQIVTFLYAAANKPAVSGENPFEDVGESDWYLNPVLWAAEEGVTGGIGEGKFGPNDVCTRAQVVTFLYKVFASK